MSKNCVYRPARPCLCLKTTKRLPQMDFLSVLLENQLWFGNLFTIHPCKNGYFLFPLLFLKLEKRDYFKKRWYTYRIDKGGLFAVIPHQFGLVIEVESHKIMSGHEVYFYQLVQPSKRDH